jgi:hypothetical protein
MVIADIATSMIKTNTGKARNSMVRLIDADVMKKSFETNCKEINDFLIDLIDSQPTAYDVDKVVEQLEAWKRQSGDGLIAVGVATEIVKGGIYEN